MAGTFVFDECHICPTEEHEMKIQSESYGMGLKLCTTLHS